MSCYELIPVQGASCPRGEGPTPVYNTARCTAQCGGCPCCCERGGEVSAQSGSVCLHLVDVSLHKAVSPTCVRRGEQVCYTITIRNDSTLPVAGLVLSDQVLGRCFDVEAIQINGVPVSGGNLAAGITVPGIGAGAQSVVTVQAVPRADSPDLIQNVARAVFNMAGDCACACGTRMDISSNPVWLRILEPGLEVSKQADRRCLTRGENVVTYTVTATNTGNCALSDVVVTDQLPQGLDYVACSTRINGGEPYDRSPALGIHVGSLEPEESAEVAFQASWAFPALPPAEEDCCDCDCGCGCGN